MIVFRLAKEKFQDLSGKGAELYGGRWNSKGKALVYTSSSRALAVTECLVHLATDIIPEFVMISLEIPDNLEIKELNHNELPANWSEYPPGFRTQQIGNEFIDTNKYLILKVPSAVIKGDFNYLINPRHKNIDKIKNISVELFSIDKRLLL